MMVQIVELDIDRVRISNIERKEAISLANRVLDKPYIDPDGDISLLARMFLREIDWAEHYRQHLARSIDAIDDAILAWSRVARNAEGEVALANLKKAGDLSR